MPCSICKARGMFLILKAIHTQNHQTSGIVMLTRWAFIQVTPLDQKVIEVLSVCSTPRPSPLYSLVSYRQGPGRVKQKFCFYRKKLRQNWEPLWASNCVRWQKTRSRKTVRGDRNSARRVDAYRWIGEAFLVAAKQALDAGTFVMVLDLKLCIGIEDTIPMNWNGRCDY